MKQLAVYWNDVRAGTLTEMKPGFGYLFEYTDEYLESKLPSISLNLPKSSKRYESEHLFPFFSNMLPEGGNKRVICRAFRIDEADLFGLLTVMADQDFIGAVNIRTMPEESNLENTTKDAGKRPSSCFPSASKPEDGTTVNVYGSLPFILGFSI